MRMNSAERLQRAIAGRPTDIPAVAPAYLVLYLDEQIQRFYREAYERKAGLDGSAGRSGTAAAIPDAAAGQSTTPKTAASGPKQSCGRTKCS